MLNIAKFVNQDSYEKTYTLVNLVDDVRCLKTSYKILVLVEYLLQKGGDKFDIDMDCNLLFKDSFGTFMKYSNVFTNLSLKNCFIDPNNLSVLQI